jgi:hypothetical protein
LTAFAFVSLSGLFFIFCKALSLGANPWMKLSLFFLPILFSTVFFLISGVLLVRQHLQIGKEPAFRRLAASSVDIAIGTSYLSFPPILAYLCLWSLLGIFFLLKEIPFIGPFFNIIFAFGPFLLIVCSLLLCLLNFALLFFVAPIVAKISPKDFQGIEFGRRIWTMLKAKPFVSGALFIIGVLPALVVGSILTLAAVLTNVSFALAGPSFALALEWFFVMLPFSALLSPAIVFFFQFAAESHQTLRKP